MARKNRKEIQEEVKQLEEQLHEVQHDLEEFPEEEIGGDDSEGTSPGADPAPTGSGETSKEGKIFCGYHPTTLEEVWL